MTRKPKEMKTPAPAAGAHTFAALAHRATFTYAGGSRPSTPPGRYLKVASTHATNLTTRKLCRFAPDDHVDVP